MKITALQVLIFKSNSWIARTFALPFVMILASLSCGQNLDLEAPARATDAPDGERLLTLLGETSGTLRQDEMLRQILAGNIPSRFRKLHGVCWNAAIPNEAGTLVSKRVCIYVSSDYLSIGSDADSLRVPIMPHYAQRVADAWHCILPTPTIVDRIYKQADVHLPPHPFNPRVYEISSLAVWNLSDKAINDQLAEASLTDEAIISGIKKDVVVTNRLAEKSRSPRVAIYGWHKLDNAPIQPLTLVHVASYVDYSHGIRLISDTMTIDGATTSVTSILESPALAWVLSDEGPMTSATIRYPY